LIFVCVLLSTFCFSSVSYSKNDYKLLMKYKSELVTNHSKMKANNKILLYTIKTSKYTGYDIYSKFLSLTDDLLWSSDMITFFSKTYRQRYHRNKMIINRLIYIQEGLQIDLTLISKTYVYIKITSLLQIIDEQQTIIRSSLETLDRTIRITKRMTRNQSKKKSK